MIISIRNEISKSFFFKEISGSNKPYYLVDKGLKLSCVFVRHGNVSAPVTDELTRKIILENYDAFENQVSQNQKYYIERINQL